MSLILDALKRSEETNSPSSHAPPGPHQSIDAMRLRPVVVALLTGALLGAGLVAWLSLGLPDDEVSSGPLATSLQPMDSGQSVSPAAGDQPNRLNRVKADQAVTAQAEPVLITDPSMQGRAAAPSEVSLPPRRVDAGSDDTARAVAELNAQMWSDSESAAVEAPDRAAQRPAEKAAEKAASEPEAPQLSETQSPPSEVADLDLTPPPIDLEKVIAAAAMAAGEQPLVPHAATMVENLSQQAKDDIPTLIYSAHDFQPDGSATVELNGRRVKVGQRLGQVVVRDILIDSVILENNGVIFRLAALNSWVNM